MATATFRSSILFFVAVFSLLATSMVTATESPRVELSVSEHVLSRFGKPPTVPTGPLAKDVEEALDTAFVVSLENSSWGQDQAIALITLAESDDARVAWLVADMMRFVGGSNVMPELGNVITSLLGIEFKNGNYWGATTDQLIAWDVPAPPNYLALKRNIFTSFVPGWEEIFKEGDIDWRHVSWGGVLIDDRPYDTTGTPCNCIPAADNPTTIAAADADWLDDDDIVFGVEVNGEYRAYPRQIMEVREMVNDTLGGRDLGIPYCTLCGSAQAYFTDELPDGVERPVLRTSGLLIRSNKVMYDITSNSVFDTFLGNAVTGPLAEKGVQLAQASVVTTDWGTWKKSYPSTTVLAESLSLGRDFDFRNNRDANGPIFPVGDVDPRLSVHEDILGVLTTSGDAIAFQKSAAVAALIRGDAVELGDISLELSGGGVKAVNAAGDDIGSHEAFWFAWSQFHPGTKLWPM